MFMKRTAPLNFTFIRIKCKICCIVISSSRNIWALLLNTEFNTTKQINVYGMWIKVFFKNSNEQTLCTATIKYAVGHLNGWNKNVLCRYPPQR